MKTTQEQYTAQAKAQLLELDAKIDALESRFADATQEARDKYHAEIVKLHRQSEQATDKLVSLVASGDQAWDAFVGEMNKLLEALSHSYHYFKSQL